MLRTIMPHNRRGGGQKPSMREIPLEWCFAPGVRLDLRTIPAGEFITPDDLENSLAQIGYSLQGGEIVLLQTGADAALKTPAYFEQPGLGRDGVLWLTDKE
ncbi:MAG: cyclase family protein [Planctomycetales bacterium]